MPMTDAISMRALRFFLAVFETQSFSVVARREGVSASMISRTIHQLEDALGQQLFYRNTRAVIATEAGRLFVEYARAISEQLGQAQEELQNRASEPAGLVRINAPVFFGQRHIAPGLTALAARYPQLRIELTLTDDYIDPHRDPADVVFRIGTLSDASWHARVFGTQRYYLAASQAYLAQQGTPTTPQALHQHSCLVYRGSSGPNRWLFRHQDDEWVHHPVPARLASNNAMTLLTAALDGMGIVLFPDWLISERLASGELVRLLPDWEAAINPEPQHIAALYPHARHPPLNVRAVIDYYLERFGTPLYWQQ